MTTLLVANTGGHLAELRQLVGTVLPADERRVWVTSDSPQSRSMLVGEEVRWVPEVSPRDYLGLLRTLPRAEGIIRETQPSQVLSTGSALALGFLPLARLHGIRSHYIESAARTVSPSLTGRVLTLVPGVQLTTQYRHWRRRRWRPGPSVFDGFVARPVDAAVDTEPPLRRVLVTVGTMEFPFRRLVRRVLDVLPAGVEVTWQTGHTPTDGLALTGSPFLEHEALRRAMRSADVVISHAGIGSALAALEVGHRPVLVPRRAARGEHVDDHQEQVARELESRGLAVVAEADELTLAHVLSAGRTRVERGR